ncbi:DNA replication complex GINS family protein [Halomicrobium katesii]|uniref:hypothetical protein n=1 Tax=Halomicrobium katesii TaxID=437163 RepID=UPI00036CA2FD|nr:hypothetical protein [Halomicrobium katesii]
MTDLDIEDIRAARAREQDQSSLVELGDPTIFDRLDDAVDADEIDADRSFELATELADERAAKILQLASLNAAGMTVNWDGVADDERALVDDLVARIEEWRESILPDPHPDEGGDDGGE